MQRNVPAKIHNEYKIYQNTVHIFAGKGVGHLLKALVPVPFALEIQDKLFNGSEVGWVTASYFDLDVSVDSLEVVDVIVTREGPSGSLTLTLPPPNNLIAFWNESSKSSNQDGTWAVNLSVRVPDDGSY